MHIFTLPITPGKRRPFTTFFTPFVADMVSHITESPVTVMLNTVGNKITTEFASSSDAFEAYVQWLRVFGMRKSSRYSIFHDGDDGYDEMIRTILPLIERASRVVMECFMCCPCGAIELQRDLFKEICLRKRADSLIEKRDSGFFCSVCHEELYESCHEVVAMQAERVFVDAVFPDFYCHEVRVMADRLSKRLIYMTRRTKTTGRRYVLHQKIWNLDTDIRWAFFLALLSKSDPIVLVTSMSTLNQALLSVGLARWIKPDLKVRLIIHPYVHIKDEQMHLHGLTVDELRDLNVDEKTLRLFMSLGLQWRHQSSTVSSMDIHWAKLSAQGIDRSVPMIGSVKGVDIPFVTAQRIRKLMKRMRAKTELSQEDRYLMRAILQ